MKVNTCRIALYKLIDDMNCIQLESDKEILEFMEKSECIYEFPLPAVDSKLVHRPVADENVDK